MSSQDIYLFCLIFIGQLFLANSHASQFQILSTKEDESEFISDFNLQDFNHCHIILYEFILPLNVFPQYIPVVRLSPYLVPEHIRKQIKDKIYAGWGERKQSCQLVYFHYPATDRIAQQRLASSVEKAALNSLSWMTDCPRNPRFAKITRACYGKQMYILATWDISGILLPSNWQVVVAYHLKRTEKSTTVTVLAETACGSQLSISWENKHFAQFSLRRLLDKLYFEFQAKFCGIIFQIFSYNPRQELRINGLFNATMISISNPNVLEFLLNSVIISNLDDYKKWEFGSTPITTEVRRTQWQESFRRKLLIRPDSAIYEEVAGSAFESDSRTYRLVVGEESYNFLTCHEAPIYISLDIFMRPFHRWLWICTIVCFYFIATGLKLEFLRLRILDGVLFMLLKAILEQGVQLSRKLSKFTHLKCILSSVFLVCLILTNSYRGIITSDLTSPLPITRLQHISEAVKENYSIIISTKMEDKRMLKWGYAMFPTNLQFYQMVANVNSFVKIVVSRVESLIGRAEAWNSFHNEIQDHAFLKFYHSLLIDVEFDANGRVDGSNVAEVKLRECNKTIIVGRREELDNIHFKIQSTNSTPQLYYGKDRFMPHGIAWIMTDMEWDRLDIVYNRCQLMISAGIPTRRYVEEEVEHKEPNSLKGIRKRVVFKRVETEQDNVVALSFQIEKTGLILGFKSATKIEAAVNK